MKLARLNNVPEVFHSLQGEGASIGMPAVFVRLAGCNLACSWCDTAYSWDGSVRAVEMEPCDVAELVLRFPCRRLVLTGGEPLVQQKELPDFLELLPNHMMEVETNGTIIPDAAVARRISQLNVSPKLAHAGNARSLNPAVLSWFANEAGEKSWFKFVVESERDIKDVEFLIETCGVERSRVIVMPQAGSLACLEGVRRNVAELCIRRGFRFPDRLHMTLWGDKKGV